MQKVGPGSFGGGVAVCWGRAHWVRRSLRCPVQDDNRKPRDDPRQKVRRGEWVEEKEKKGGDGRREKERDGGIGRDGLGRSVKREPRPWATFLPSFELVRLRSLIPRYRSGQPGSARIDHFLIARRINATAPIRFAGSFAGCNLSTGRF